MRRAPPPVRKPRELDHLDLLISWTKTALLILNFLLRPGSTLSFPRESLQLEAIAQSLRASSLKRSENHCSCTCLTHSLIALWIGLYALFFPPFPSVHIVGAHKMSTEIELNRRDNARKLSGSRPALAKSSRLRLCTWAAYFYGLDEFLGSRTFNNWNMYENLSKLVNKGNKTKPTQSTLLLFYF